MGNRVGNGEVYGNDSQQTMKSKRKNRKRIIGPTPKPTKMKAIRKKSNNPPSAYALFIRDVRNQLFESRVSFNELVVSCSQKWRQMGSEEKQKYHQMAKDIRENMLRIGGQAKRRTIKDPKTRKKTNFWNFADKIRSDVWKEMKESNGSRPKMVDVNREIGRRWHALSQEEKNQFKTVVN